MTYSEKEFSDNFIKTISPKDLFGVSAFMYEQIDSSSGIPDVLMTTESDTLKLTEFKELYPDINLTNGHAKVVSTLSYGKSLKLATIHRKSGLSYKHFQKALADLEKMDIVIENSAGNYRINKSFVIPSIRLWSIEFKLNDWKKALVQSIRYRTFSTKVLIVMPSQKRKLLMSKSNIFRKYKIGVGTYDINTNKFEYVVRPLICGALSNSQYLDALGKLSSHKNFKISIGI